MLKSFEQVKESLLSGNSFVSSVGSKQAYRAVAERIDGKETGNQVVKAVGGRVSRRIAENSLLQGFQSLSVRCGFSEFGNDALVMISEKDEKGNFLMSENEVIEAFATLKVDSGKLKSLVTRYLKMIQNELLITELQAVELLQAVAFSELETAKSVEVATSDDKTETQRQVDRYNEQVALDRAKQVAALSKGAGA